MHGSRMLDAGVAMRDRPSDRLAVVGGETTLENTAPCCKRIASSSIHGDWAVAQIARQRRGCGVDLSHRAGTVTCAAAPATAGSPCSRMSSSAARAIPSLAVVEAPDGRLRRPFASGRVRCAHESARRRGAPPPRADAPGDAGSVPLDFTAIDFETANSSNASACAVGLARVRDGRVVATAGWLIQPPPGHDRFFELNTRIHGIRAEDVIGAKGWSEQLDDLAAFAGDDVLVAHNAGFDMACSSRACEATGDDCPPYRYVCSLQVARKVYQLESYRLPFVAADAGFADFAHHDATADALACAHIMIDAGRARVGADDIDALAAVGRASGSRRSPSPTAARASRSPSPESRSR